MAIAYVNGVGNYGTLSATTIAAPAANHTTGNLLVVFVGTDFTYTVSSIADTAGNTYIYVTRIQSPQTGSIIECWYANNITGNASNVVTATYSGTTTDRTIIVDQYSGCDTTAPLDQYNTGWGNSDTPTTGNITTTAADEVLVAGVHVYNLGTFTAGTNYTLRTLTDPVPSKGASEDRIVSATGTYNATFLNGSQYWVTIVASFKAAAVAGPAAVGSSMAAKMMAAGVL